MHAVLKLQCGWVTGNKKFTIGGLILHNVEESSGDNGQVRKEQDVNKATFIFNEYMGIKPTVVNALRIGKRRDAGSDVKPRLLKLTLASEQDKASLLRNCTKL